MKVINDEIVVTFEGGVLILNGELETVKRFTDRHTDYCAACIDGNEEYIATGQHDGYVHFYSRKRKGESERKVRKQTHVEPTINNPRLLYRFTNTS